MADRRWKLWGTVNVSSTTEVSGTDDALLKQGRELNLVLVSGEELGLSDEAPYDEVCERANELGLQLCPPAILIPLCSKDFPLEQDKWHIIALSPRYGEHGRMVAYYMVSEEAGLSLRTHQCTRDTSWHHFDMFIFVCPKELLE